MDLKNKRVLVTGASGLVGRQLQAELVTRGVAYDVARSSLEADLRDQRCVEGLFSESKPEIVFHLAARVGGILDNKTSPADFYFDNIRMSAYLFDACARHKVEKLVCLGTGCGYPVGAPEPLREEDYWKGLPQPESAAYAMAKKMDLVQAVAYRQQYGLKTVVLLPSNIYGPHDNFDLERAHAIPALIRRFYESTRNGHPVRVWGSGNAKRDFIHVADVARALVDAAETYDREEPLNIASGLQYPVWEIVSELQRISGFAGEVVYDKTKPEGQLSRAFSQENQHRYLPQLKRIYGLAAGLSETYLWFADNYATARLDRGRKAV